MPLTSQKMGKIALIVLQEKLEKDGITLKPDEVRREVSNSAKKMGIPSHQAAEFVKVVITKAYARTMAELDIMIADVSK